MKRRGNVNFAHHKNRIMVSIWEPGSLGHTVIQTSTRLAFRAGLAPLERKYLEREIQIAIRSALILQFGLRAVEVEPHLSEEKLSEDDLFAWGMLPGTTLPGTSE